MKYTSYLFDFDGTLVDSETLYTKSLIFTANKMNVLQNVNFESMAGYQTQDMYNILKEALYEFPVLEIKVNMPEWIAILNPDHPVKKSYISSIKESVVEIDKLKDIDEVSYVRFASVYRQFKDINTFVSELKNILMQEGD